MLLFINISILHCQTLVNSNTSLVLIYLVNSTQYGWIPYRFKYISWSYLSQSCNSRYRGNLIQIHLMFLFIAEAKRKEMEGSQFKYISCSYLSRNPSNLFTNKCHSNTSHVLIYLVLAVPERRFFNLFKYISCSYLSVVSIGAASNIPYSNTSHVLIYRIQGFSFRICSAIQIHLMFLFIRRYDRVLKQIL